MQNIISKNKFFQDPSDYVELEFIYQSLNS